MVFSSLMGSFRRALSTTNTVLEWVLHKRYNIFVTLATVYFNCKYQLIMLWGSSSSSCVFTSWNLCVGYLSVGVKTDGNRYFSQFATVIGHKDSMFDVRWCVIHWEKKWSFTKNRGKRCTILCYMLGLELPSNLIPSKGSHLSTVSQSWGVTGGKTGG